MGISEKDKAAARRSDPIVAEAVLAAVSASYGIEPAVLISARRTAGIVEAREAAMWLLRHRGLSFTRIGKTFNREHTTAMYGVKKATAAAETDEKARRYLDMLKADVVGRLATAERTRASED